MSAIRKLPLGARRALDIAEGLATEIWRVERSPEIAFVSGLNEVRVVRDRLSRLGQRLLEEPALGLEARSLLTEFDWIVTPAPSIRTMTERLVAVVFSGNEFAGPEALLEICTGFSKLVLDMVVVQSLAARLGHWSPKPHELADARVARGLLRQSSSRDWQDYNLLLQEARTLFDRRQYREAARLWIDGDRLVRTSTGLQSAAEAFYRAGDLASALWAIRAALLEPKDTFESRDALLEAHTLEARLREIVERMRGPLSFEEEQWLLTDDSLANAPVKEPAEVQTYAYGADDEEALEWHEVLFVADTVSSEAASVPGSSARLSLASFTNEVGAEASRALAGPKKVRPRTRPSPGLLSHDEPFPSGASIPGRQVTAIRVERVDEDRPPALEERRVSVTTESGILTLVGEPHLLLLLSKALTGSHPPHAERDRAAGK